MHQSTHFIEGHLPNQERAKQLTMRVLDIIDSYKKHLVSDFQIVPNVVSATEDENGVLRLRLIVENKGRVPLRDVSFSLHPHMSAVYRQTFPSFPPAMSSSWSSKEAIIVL